MDAVEGCPNAYHFDNLCHKLNEMKVDFDRSKAVLAQKSPGEQFKKREMLLLKGHTHNVEKRLVQKSSESEHSGASFALVDLAGRQMFWRSSFFERRISK